MTYIGLAKLLILIRFQVVLLGYQNNPRMDVQTCGITTHMSIHLLELYLDQQKT